MAAYYQECLENEKKTITDLRILVPKVLSGSLINITDIFIILVGGAWTASCSGLPYRLKNPVLTEEKTMRYTTALLKSSRIQFLKTALVLQGILL